MQIQPYLFYNGRCDEAIAHYQQAHCWRNMGSSWLFLLPR